MNGKNLKEISIKIRSDLKNNLYESGSQEIREFNLSDNESTVLYGSKEARSTLINFKKNINTNKPYHVLSLNGRTENNKNLVHNTGSLQTNKVSEEFYDTSIQERSANKNIFVNKFSSPGAETAAEISLNRESGEYSPYNTLNYKNLLVRKNLTEWLSEPFILNSEIPSFHRTNKNPIYKVNPNYQFNGEENITASFIDDVEYDNYFIRHQIPQSDKQYSWIRNSLSKNNIFEPQYRDFENQKIFENIKFYDAKKIDNTNIISIYLKNNKLYLGYLKISQIGRERTIELISEEAIPSNDFGAPLISLLTNNSGIVFSTWISDDNNEYPIFCAFKIENSKVLISQPIKNSSIIFTSAQHNYNISTSEIDFILYRLQNNYFCAANNGRIFIGSLDENLNITIGTSQNFIGENPNIFPIDNTNFIFSYYDSGINAQCYKSVSYDTSSLNFIINSDFQTSVGLGHTKYSYLCKDENNNSYYTLIYKNGNIDASLLKINSTLTSSIVSSISVGESLNDNVHFINNNTNDSSLINYSLTSSVDKFKSIYLINNSSSLNNKLSIGILDIDLSTETIVNKSSKDILASTASDVGLFNVVSNDNKSLDTFIIYNNNNNTIYEHCAISKDQFFTYFVDRSEYDNNLELLWKKELYKNFSIYNTKLPDYEEKYYFSYKTELIDPVVEFCGTNISIIKDYNFETNTLSLLNLDESIRLREFLTNLNGFYGFSSWKQISNSNKYFNVNLRRKNYYFGQNINFVEPVFTIQSPLKIISKDISGLEILEDSYLTKHTFFTNEKLRDSLSNPVFTLLNNNTQYQIFKNSEKDYISISLKENLYPKKQFLTDTRKRNIYDETNKLNHDKDINNTNEFWKSTKTSRQKTLNNSKNNLNFDNENITNDEENKKNKSLFPNIISQTNLTKSWIGANTSIGYSIWPSDNYFVHNNTGYTFSDYQNLFSGSSVIFNIDSQVSSAYYDVELDTTRVIGDLSYPGYIEERKLTYFIPSNLFGIKSTPRTQFIFNPFNITENFEPFGWEYKTVDISKKEPWYNTYEQYIEELRLIGQNYSILPEYNISDNINNYLKRGLELINKDFLSIKGEQISSSLQKIDEVERIFSVNSMASEELNVAKDSDFLGYHLYNKLYSKNISLTEDSVEKQNYNLPNSIIRNISLNEPELELATSLKINNTGDESELYVNFDSINDYLSQSYNLTSPNLIHTSFGVSTWFKLSKESVQNKELSGLYSFINSNGTTPYEKLSFGVFLNASGSDLGNGNISDTDIVLYNNGKHDTGIETKNIIKLYNNESIASGTADFPSSKILLDDKWHHLFVQYVKPLEYDFSPNFDQKQKEYTLFPESDQSYGYLKNTFKYPEYFKNSRKNILLREEGDSYIIASMNIFGNNDDVSKFSDEKNIGINIYKLRGSEYTLLDRKIIPFLRKSYILDRVFLNNTNISDYSLMDFTSLDSLYLGKYNSKDTFIIIVNYRGIPNSDEQLFAGGQIWRNYTDYIFVEFSDKIVDSGFKQLSPDLLDYNLSELNYYSKYPTSLVVNGINYKDNKLESLVINNSTYNKNQYNHLSKINEYTINYFNKTLDFNLNIVERNTFQEIVHPILSDKVTSIVPVKTFLNDYYPTSSFIELFMTGSGSSRETKIFYHEKNGSLYSQTESSFKIDSPEFKESKLYYFNVDPANLNTETTLFVNTVIPKEGVGKLNLFTFNNTTNTGITSSNTNEYTDYPYELNLDFPNNLSSSLFNDLYIHNPTSSFANGTILLPVNNNLTTSLTLYFANDLYSYNKYKNINEEVLMDTSFISTLQQNYTFNFDSFSYNVPFTYFNTSSLSAKLTTVKVDTRRGGSETNIDKNAAINVYLDGYKKYGLNISSTGTLGFQNYPLDSQPYSNTLDYSDPSKSENSLNKFIIGYATGSHFLTKSVPFSGEVDEVTLWQGHYTDASIQKIYNNGITKNPNTISEEFKLDPSTYRIFDDAYPTLFSPVLVPNNIFAWYRIGYPELNKNINEIEYKYNDNFFEKYGLLDNLSYYKEGDNIVTHYESINNDLSSSIKKISITVNGISRLLPYNGFYPQQRTAQIGKLFLDSLGGFDQFSDENKNINLTNLDDPKKNNGVYKINNESVLQSVLQPFMAPGILFNSIKSGLAVDWPVYLDNTVSETGSISDKIPSFYKTSSAGIDLNRDGIKYVISRDLNSSLKRVPFETLVDFNNFPKKENSDKTDIIYLQNPTIYSLSGSDKTFNEVYPYFIWNGSKKDSNYELAINNFVAETPRFFLQNKGLTSFISKPSKDLLPTVSGTLYAMDISIYKDRDFDMVISPNNTAKGKYFGPPVNYYGNSSAEVSASINDPAYSPYVPSYFYGKSVLRLKYLADKSSTSIKEIISKLQIEEISTELDELFKNLSGSKTSTAYTDKMSLASSIVYNKTIIDPSVTIKEGDFSRQFTDNVSDNEQNRRWIISTKWESPCINFNDKNSINYSLNFNDSFTKTDIPVFNSLINQTDRVEIKPVAGTGMWYGYSKNYESGLKMSISTPFKETFQTSSLATLCGFETNEKKIGQIANNKKIYESIVLIPYYENDKETNTTDKFIFLNIQKDKFKEAYNHYISNKNSEFSPNSIVDMIRKIEKYEIPLHLNFLEKAKNNNFTDYNPFAMYLFEFSRDLDKEDLADIWQGILPKIGTEAKKDSAIIHHEFNENELISKIDDPKNLKWLIFKVKRKAEKFYSDLTDYKDEKFELLKLESNLNNIGYNWPYDYCSLIELANVNIEFNFENKDIKE